MTSIKVSEVRDALPHFPLATRRVAVRHAIKLVKARQYLRDRGIYATDRFSEFDYKMSTGSVLGYD